MKETDLLEVVRSLLVSDGMNPHRSLTYSATPDESQDESGSDLDWVDGAMSSDEGFPTPESEDELRDVLIELNITSHEYIRMALEHHGGRLRQQEVTELTGWSAPTVSQKLSEMEDEGLITRFRAGREKIVCLPDESPDEADAPSQ